MINIGRQNSTPNIAIIIEPEISNCSGFAHGGEIVKLMDMAAGVEAIRYSKGPVVTARIDNLEFHHPIPIGSLVTCYAYLNYVGRSSMELFVEVICEDMAKGNTVLAVTGIFTMVAVDSGGKPRPVIPFEPKDEEERKIFEEARLRQLSYKNNRGGKNNTR